MTNRHAALLSALLPGLGQLAQGRHRSALTACAGTLLLVGLSVWSGRVTDRAVEVLVFMVLALPCWALQSYDAYLGPGDTRPDALRTWTVVWQRGHDIRFLGLLLLISALNDTWIILKNLDYLLPFYCTRLDGVAGFATKAISPALHLAVGYGFIRLRRCALFVYLVYAEYGFTNGMVNLNAPDRVCRRRGGRLGIPLPQESPHHECDGTRRADPDRRRSQRSGRQDRQARPRLHGDGERGMADMAEMDMPLPDNTLPMMTGQGPFGPLEMGGMFTTMKVRRGQKRGDYSDPGWYSQPPGTQAHEVTGVLAEPLRAPPAASAQGKSGDTEVTVRKPTGHAGH